MTDAGRDRALRGLYPIPSWARDPSRPPSDKRAPVFGVEVEARDSSGKTIVALLEWELTVRIKTALNNGTCGVECKVEPPPAGCLGAGCNLMVIPQTSIIFDCDTDTQYKLCRYIPPWARDPKTTYNNEDDPIYGIEVQPLPEHVQPGLEYRVAPVGFELSKRIERARNTPGVYLEFCDVESVPCGHLGDKNNFAVQRGGNILRDKDTLCEYRLRPFTPKFHIARTPSWAMKLPDFYQTEPGRHATSFVGIKVKVKGIETVAIPNTSQLNLIDMLKKGFSDSWTTCSCGGVSFKVNGFKSLIKKVGEDKAYCLVHMISPKTLSDPYKPDVTDPFSTDIFTVHLQNGTTESVVVSDGDFKGYILHHFVEILDNNQVVPIKHDFCGAYEDKPSWTKSGGKNISHGRFIWLYQDTDKEKTRPIQMMPFPVKPYERKISEGLEEAKLNGQRTYSFELETDEGIIEYEVDLTTDRMIQKRKDSPAHARRVWRVGTEFKSTLCECWKLSQKLSPVSGEFPPNWDFKGDGPTFLEMDCEEAKDVLKMIKDSIDGYEKVKQPQTGLGENWGDDGEVLRTSAGRPVHFVDESGQERMEKPKAIHVVGIMRLQRQIQYNAFRAYQNNILFTRGSQLFYEPESRYMADNPMETGPMTDNRVNEVWAFHGTKPFTACQIINNIVIPDVRATNPHNLFGYGLYFTDCFVKASKYCGCAVCNCGQRGAQGVHKECVCKQRNTTHPRIAFLARVTMGKPLIVRDVAQYLMHRPGVGSDGYPTLGFNKQFPATLWFDSVDRDITKQQRNNQRFVAVSDLSEQDKDYVPWLFYIKNATGFSSGYMALLKKIQTMDIRKVPFGIIVDDGASDQSVAFAYKLRKCLNACHADECLYTPDDTSLEKVLREHIDDENLNNIIQRESDVTVDPLKLRKEPGKGMRVVIPDMMDEDKEGHADSVFVEDVIHGRPSQLLEHKVALPSMIRARQNKRREMVAFDDRSVYYEYAILFYEYESEKAMIENIPFEYPNNRHGIDKKENPLYFLLRDYCLDSVCETEHSDNSKGTPKTGIPHIPPPDPVTEHNPAFDLGRFTFDQF